MSGPVAPSRFFRVRIGVPTRTAVVVLALVVALVAPSDALGARSVPKGFFGMNWDQEVSYRTSPGTRFAQWGNMAASGVESARVQTLASCDDWTTTLLRLKLQDRRPE